MYTPWPCPMPDGSTGEEIALVFDQQRSKRVLMVAPLFDESNKLRHQLYEIMRLLDEAGIDSALPDLPGCNESLAPFPAQTLGHWRTSVAAAAAHFGATHVFAVRSGCWLAPDGMEGWLYAPAKPKQVLRSMIRARVLAAREAGTEEIADALMERGRTEGLTLAGWPLGADLLQELETAEVVTPPGYSIVEQATVGGKPLWLRAENDDDADQAQALVALIVGQEAEQ